MRKERSFLFLGRRWVILEVAQDEKVTTLVEKMRKMVSFSRLRGFCD